MKTQREWLTLVVAGTALVTLAGCGGGGGGGSTSTAAPPGSGPATTDPATAATSISVTAGTDTATLGSADISSKLSMAGSWIPIDNNAGALVGPFWNNLRIGADQLEGLTFGGWAYTGFSNTATAVTPVRAVVLQQQANGLMAEATSAVFGNAMTNGAGSIIVADFNGDGRDDVVFPAHNESPFIAMPSTAYMSRADGGFNKITLPDSVMNHDARLVTLGGTKKILSRSFGGSGVGGKGAGYNVIYGWGGSNFNVDLSLGDLAGQSVLAGKFNGDNSDWLIIGDSTFGPGVTYAPTNSMLNYAYKYAGGVVTTPALSLPTPYFNNKPEYAGFASAWDPYSKTHTSRLWMTDLNQDGLPDILAGQEIWRDGPGLQRSVFQMLINRGSMAFADQTDALQPEYAKNSYSIDYSLRLVDVDGSGIDSMFLAGGAYTPSLTTVHGNYLLVNDGTGRLYAVMHDQFNGMASKLIAFVQAQLPTNKNANPNSVPSFYPYRTKGGLINYVAMVSTGGGYSFVNLPLAINLATDFRRDLTVTTRNGSKNIRTFAGNDTIFRALGDPDCRIDGGLGTNTVVYPGKRSDWVIARAGSQFTARPASSDSGGTDTLTRIQKARFDDQTLELTSLP